MLLLELKPTVPISKKSISGIIPKNDNLEWLGTGAQAIAHSIKNKPNMVLKTINILSNNDPVIAFLRICINNKNNPYLPKIYKVKVYNSSNIDTDTFHQEYNNNIPDPDHIPPDQGTKVVLIVMEKLFPLVSDVSNSMRLLKDVGIFDQSQSHPKINTFSNTYTSIGPTKIKFDNKSSRRELYNSTTDPQFKSVLRLLEPIFSSGMVQNDMHGGNIMLRKDPLGLVIIDPVIINPSKTS